MEWQEDLPENSDNLRDKASTCKARSVNDCIV